MVDRGCGEGLRLVDSSTGVAKAGILGEETVCQGLPDLRDALLGSGDAVAVGGPCCIRLRSLCESLAAPRLKEPGVSGSIGLDAASPCDSEDVRPVAACAMMSRMSLRGPGNGVRLQGCPELGGVLPLMRGDFGVRGVAIPVTDDCGRSFGEGSTLPLESNHTSSSGLEAIGSRPRGLDMGLIDGD